MICGQVQSFAILGGMSTGVVTDYYDGTSLVYQRYKPGGYRTLGETHLTDPLGMMYILRCAQGRFFARQYSEECGKFWVIIICRTLGDQLLSRLISADSFVPKRFSRIVRIGMLIMNLDRRENYVFTKPKE